MGITIHYHLSTQKEWSEENVREWLEIVADYARHLGCTSVGPVVPAYNYRLGNFSGLDNVTDILHKVGRRIKKRYVPISPKEGSVVAIDVGEGCQWLVLALCKYPGMWRCHHGRSMQRWHPTNISNEWQFSWFCKTQFAGQHGAAHFLHCHKTVISLLDFCRKAGLDVSVRDEAGYWEKRDDTDLRETLRRNEALLAAFGGWLKDLADPLPDRKVESPIFDYANFEHLEQEGWERYGKLFALMPKAIRSNNTAAGR